jgi:NADPH:quinone reductase-like Zn-dependent oxidoreductase
LANGVYFLNPKLPSVIGGEGAGIVEAIRPGATSVKVFWMYYEEYLPKMRAALTEATKVVASGKLTLPVTTTYKLSQIKEAIEHSQRSGKVLLDFNDPN